VRAVPWPYVVREVLFRAACLLGLAVAPPFLSPEPRTPENLDLAAVVSLALLVAAAYGAFRLRAARGGLAAPALIGLALVAAVVCAAIFRGDRAPLGRGLLFVAIPLWGGLANAAGVVAERRRGPGWRSFAARLTAATGSLLLLASAGWMFSAERMWARVAATGGDSRRALDALTGGKLRARDYEGAILALDRCVEASPDACACLAGRADVRTRVPGADRSALDQAVADARAAVARCPKDPGARAALATTLAASGDGAEAERTARDALVDGDDPRVRYALAVALDRQGRAADALAEAKRAVDGGAGRDAALMVGALSITAGDLDGARRALTPLAADAGDAAVQYDLALVADRTNDYNRARQGYLAALRADPTLAAARYNLVVLTLRYGVVDEAKHHARSFAEAFPGDPRRAELERMVAAAAAPRR
jgi:tetratricopeptide (TPR) repeat protein